MNEDLTYSQSAKGVTITHARALTELRTHGLTDAEDIADFHASLGEHPTYNAHAVLVWLGY